MRRAMKAHRVTLGLMALAVVAATSSAAAQESGADVWARSCGRCHRQQPPNKYDADSWRAIMGHMALNARLTSDEETAVRQFLMGAARRLTMESASERTRPVLLASTDAALLPIAELPEGAELFGQHCVACHGEQGKGDGPASAALTPRPSDLTDTQRMSELSDEQLIAIIASGRDSMPGFDKLLSPDQLKLVVEYVRRLSEQEKK